MKAEYTLAVTCRCPVDHRLDHYTLTVRSPRTIPVEIILSAAKELEMKEFFQEDLTRALHRALGGEVETTGYHSGVFTRVTEGSS